MSVEGKVILVTGSTDGIGMQTALDLAGMGAHVIVHGRNRERGESVQHEIQRATGNDQVDLLTADLASQRQIHELARAIGRRYQRMDVLVNNAGVYMKQRRLTEDGLEMTFAVNHLAPFLLTHLLLDLLRTSAPSRVVTVSSTTHQSIREVDFDNLQGEKWYDGYYAYALSKLGNILFAYELARRIANAEITANTLHPGAVNTKLLRAGFGNYGIDLEQGAETPVYLASSPEVEGVTGKYFVNKRPTMSSPLSYNRELQNDFWNISEQLTDLAVPARRAA
jgi:NAD(P)-dependent dehydrogenase (short-subunit alcohol dehydrogenase family)